MLFITLFLFVIYFLILRLVIIYNDKLINVHINDATKENTCLLPGQGNIDLKNIINKVQKTNNNIHFIIEVYDSSYNTMVDLVNARKYVEKLGG